MAELFTCSYYAWKPDLGAGVRITLGHPKFMSTRGWPYITELAPRATYFHAPMEEFDRKFFAQLDRYGVPHIQAKLDEAALITGHERLVLCCFERQISGPVDCHRRLFADWWREKTGDDIPELDAAPLGRQPEPEVEQLTLFDE